MNDKKFGFIGLGLIGGSIAKSIKSNIPDAYIYAYARKRSTIEKAMSDGIVDVLLDEADDIRLSECDFIFLCAPVSINISYLSQLKNIISDKTIITDVGSTKLSICNKAIESDLASHFIGSHPMTGSEKSGYEFSDEILMENAYYIVTPLQDTKQSDLERYIEIIKKIKSIPYILDYQKHDDLVAAISHLPHLVAASLVNTVLKDDDEEGSMRRLAAGGFKDITRIASSSPIMWQQICIDNKDAIINIIDKYIKSLNIVRDNISKSDSNALFELFQRSGIYRNLISDKEEALITSENSFSVKVGDKPGAISIVSAILASHSISIKNIGINHNRELGEGQLRISFYDSDSCTLARKLLASYNYIIERG